MGRYVKLEGESIWFTAERLLFLLCMVNLLNYVDRGAIASNGVNGTVPTNSTCNVTETCHGGSGIQGDFGLSNLEDGVLSSAFMVGLLVASPIFAQCAKTCNPFRLMGVGLSVWTFATFLCGLSVDFWSITSARMLVGVGEASFISLAAPFVVDNAPSEKKTSWLSIFYMCIPVGMALGYVYGGMVGSMFNWRFAFWGEAALMFPFAVISFAAGRVQMKDEWQPDRDEFSLANEASQDRKGSPLHSSSLLKHLSRAIASLIMPLRTLVEDIKTLAQSKIYTISVLGLIAYSAVLGAYSYWGPRAGHAIFNLDNADVVFGGMTVVCGIFGTVAGGIVLDKIGSTILNGFKILTIASLIGGIACFVSFVSRTLICFIPLFSLGELFLFATQGPVNYLILQSAPAALQPLAMALSTVCIHVFGDVPSAPIVGALQDYLNDWRLTTMLLTSVFFLSTSIWFLGVFIPSKDLVQFELVGEENQLEKSQRAPLLAKMDSV